MMKRGMVWLFVVWLSIKGMYYVNLGDLVWHKQRKWVVVNGVTCGCWDLQDMPTRERVCVRYEECRKVWTPSNVIGGFTTRYRFYMGYWFDIWCRNGIEEWTKSLPIWGKR